MVQGDCVVWQILGGSNKTNKVKYLQGTYITGKSKKLLSKVLIIMIFNLPYPQKNLYDLFVLKMANY